MDKSKISEKAQLLWKKTSKVCMVEIDSSNGGSARIVWRISAINPFIAAYIRTNPGSSVVERIRENDLLPGLKGNVRIPKPVIFEHKIRRDCI